MAAVHGIDLDKETGNNFDIIPTAKKIDNFIFGDPKEYEKLPESERVALTEKMMGSHKEWAGSLKIGI